jgi:hypothetical protein
MSVQVPRLAEIDGDALEAQALAALDASATWPARASGEGYRISTGFLPGQPWRVYRSDATFASSPDAVATLLADQMIERLGDWNQEFRAGRVVTTLSDVPGDRRWLVQVHYATPSPLADREYLYWLRRHDTPAGIVITYQSVNEPEPIPTGAVRALLMGTVHRCVPDGSGTRLEHLLINDLGGRIPLWVQNHVFAGGIVTAQVRDAVAQRRLLP